MKKLIYLIIIFIILTASTVYVNDSGVTIFGTQSNNVTIDTNGVALNGNATVWDDLNFAVVRSGGPVATQPDEVMIGNLCYKEFTNLNNQLACDGEEVLHEAKLNSNLYPHAHIFLKSGESAGTTGVTFTIYWELRQSTGVTNGNLNVSATSAELTANPHKFNIYGTAFTGATELGAQLAMAIERVGGDAGDVIVITYGVHYEIDNLGSSEIDTK